MQWRDFRYFVSRVLREGRRLQRKNILGEQTTRYRYTHSEIICFLSAIGLAILLPAGINDNFAEYAIAFLGIFVGLFTSIIIALFDKGKTLYEGFDDKTNIEKTRIDIIRNYLVQFTGLTAYSIVLALISVVLLLGILLFPGARANLRSYHFVHSLAAINLATTITFVRLTAVILFRVTLLCLLLNFFSVTLFSLSSYFSFLQSEYKQLGVKSGSS
jgi:hypothetical protein